MEITKVVTPKDRLRDFFSFSHRIHCGNLLELQLAEVLKVERESAGANEELVETLRSLFSMSGCDSQICTSIEGIIPPSRNHDNDNEALDDIIVYQRNLK